jgi:GNAT superfamily N-acetyltransferase
MPRYAAPRLLEAGDLVEEFRCRSPEQTSWLQRFARASSAGGTTRVFVVTEHGRRRVVAYYAWCMGSLAIERAPARLRKGGGRYPQPVAVLARLGVDHAHEGRGLGAALLVDAITRLASLSDEIGCRALVIHAETTAAREFYLHVLPELEASPTDELHLLLLIKDVRRTLARR